MQKFLSLFVALVCNHFAFAENTLTASASQLPKWKTSFNTYYYNFEGTKSSSKADYSFGDTILKMQLLSLQYQLESGWILSATAQYYENSVDTKFVGTWYHDTSRGLADTFFSAVKPVMTSGSFMLITDLGFTAPTGSIDIKNANNSTGNVNYAYNMQMGSGTFDAVLGAASLWLQPNYQLGAHLGATLRTGEKNSNDYHLGNQYRLDLWADAPLKYGVTPRIVGYYKYKDAIRGQDSTFGRNSFVEFYHHSQINWDISAAIKYQLAFTPLAAMNAEVGIPIAQDSQNFDNVVVSTRYYVNLGVTGQF